MLQSLVATMQKHPSVALAFSGGLDSTVLAHAAREAGCDVLLFHVEGAHFSAREREHALAWAEQNDFRLVTVEVNVLDVLQVGCNTKDRCYHCKKHMFEHVKARVQAIDAHATLCDGSHADDAKAYRPGLRAVRECGVLSPFVACALGKADIRSLARHVGLAYMDRSVQPCLLTRFAYDVSPKILGGRTFLQKLDKAEEALEQAGLKEFRLRICPETVLQTQAFSMQEAYLHGILGAYGFHNVRICVESNISGFFDRQ